MIIENKVKVKGHPKNIKHFKEKGYNIKVGEEIEVDTIDLMRGSPLKVTVACDVCSSEKKLPFREYYDRTDLLKSDYFCSKCKGHKIKKTNLEKYGVENVMQLESTKEKLKKNLITKYGVDHYSKTDEFKEKFKETSLNNYGVENPFQNEEIKSKIKQTNKINFGVSYPQQNKEILEKSNKANLDKYGVERPLQSKDIIDKMYQKNLQKWNVDNTFKIEKSINNRLKTNNKLFGVDYPLQSKEIHEKIVQSYKDKYGVHHPMLNVEYLEKVKKANLDKYDLEFPFHSEEVRRKIKDVYNQRVYEKYADIKVEDVQILSYNESFFECLHISKNHKFTIHRQLLYDRNRDYTSIICTECNPMNSHGSSHEQYLKDFFETNNIKYTKNEKSIVGDNIELDFYLPEYKLAIEMNGLYWHSELFKDGKYHLNKSKKCKDKNVELIHIFEDDWLYKKEIILSILRNKVNIIPEKIFARKCIIKNVSAKEASNFLDDNHIQGTSKSKYKFGLYYNSELVSLMTFGFRKTNNKKEFELIRFCNKINTNVIGASSKLFKHVIKNIEFDYILSYSDFSMFNGKMYELLGFSQIHLSKPNYFWVVNGLREHRFKYNKQKLIKEGFDPNKTEVEIMHERGYYRIWGCGQVRWEYRK